MIRLTKVAVVSRVTAKQMRTNATVSSQTEVQSEHNGDGADACAPGSLLIDCSSSRGTIPGSEWPAKNSATRLNGTL